MQWRLCCVVPGAAKQSWHLLSVMPQHLTVRFQVCVHWPQFAADASEAPQLLDQAVVMLRSDAFPRINGASTPKKSTVMFGGAAVERE